MPGDGNRVMPPRALSRFQFHPSREPTGPRTRTPASRCATAAAAGAGRTSQRKLGVPGATRRCRSSRVGAAVEARASRRPRRVCAAPDHCEIRSAERRRRRRRAPGRRGARVLRGGMEDLAARFFFRPCQRARARGRIMTAPYARLDEAHCASRMPINEGSKGVSHRRPIQWRAPCEIPPACERGGTRFARRRIRPVARRSEQ